MTNEIDTNEVKDGQLKYRFKLTKAQWDKLADEHKEQCVHTNDPKKPYAVELFLEEVKIDGELEGMTEGQLLALAKKTHIGALQRAGRLVVATDFGLIEKSTRFVAHDRVMYEKSKDTLDALLASGALSKEGYETGLDNLKTTFGQE